MRSANGMSNGVEVLTIEKFIAVNRLNGMGGMREMVGMVELRNLAAEEIACDSGKLSLTGELISKALTVSDVRFHRVAALRLAIAAGTYQVSSEDLAEKIMGSLRG